MRFAEVFLRLGLALVAWMVIYAQFLWLAALHELGCGPDGDEMHRLLLGLAPFAVGLAIALRATRPFAEIHRMLRWLGVPLLLALPFAARSIWDVFATVNMHASAICAEATPSLWQQLWAPVQVAAVLLILAMVFRMWRSASADAGDAT